MLRPPLCDSSPARRAAGVAGAPRGARVSLPDAQAKALEEIPDNAWVLGIGAPPSFFRKHYLFDFLRLVQSFVMSASGSTGVDARFRATFANAADAALTTAMVNVMKVVILNDPGVTGDATLSATAARAFDSLQINQDDNRVSITIQIPKMAVTALLAKWHDTPLDKILQTPGFKAGKR